VVTSTIQLRHDYDTTTSLWSQVRYNYDTTTILWSQVRYDYDTTTTRLRFCGHKYDTTTTRLRHDYDFVVTSTIQVQLRHDYDTTTSLWSQVRYNYDMTTTRLRVCGHKYDTTTTRLRHDKIQDEATTRLRQRIDVLIFLFLVECCSVLQPITEQQADTSVGASSKLVKMEQPRLSDYVIESIIEYAYYHNERVLWDVDNIHFVKLEVRCDYDFVVTCTIQVRQLAPALPGGSANALL